MIGIVIVTHGELGAALIDAAGIILDEAPPAVCAVSINLGEDPERLRARINAGIDAVAGHRGVLVLTDMFGGTPSNLSFSFLEEGRIEVISGVNLPILVQAVNRRRRMDLGPLAAHLEKEGKRSIKRGSAILTGGPTSS